MKFLKCLICQGEIDIIDSSAALDKKVKCRRCGFSNRQENRNPEPEIVIMRRRPLFIEE